jgi:hypothetical protein
MVGQICDTRTVVVVPSSTATDRSLRAPPYNTLCSLHLHAIHTDTSKRAGTPLYPYTLVAGVFLRAEIRSSLDSKAADPRGSDSNTKSLLPRRSRSTCSPGS